METKPITILRSFCVIFLCTTRTMGLIPRQQQQLFVVYIFIDTWSRKSLIKKYVSKSQIEGHL